MAANGNNNGAQHTYALPKSHQEVISQVSYHPEVSPLTHLQMLEKSLLESDPEIAEIMVSKNYISVLY